MLTQEPCRRSRAERSRGRSRTSSKEVTFGDLFDEGPEEDDNEEAKEEVGEGNGDEETGGQDEVFGMLVACTFRCEFNHGVR